MLHLPHFIRAPLVGFEARMKRAKRRGKFFFRRGKRPPEARHNPAHPTVRHHESELFHELDFSEYPELTDYIRQFRNSLLHKSRVLDALSAMDLEGVDDLFGLYCSSGGNLEILRLSGTLPEKRQYIQDQLGYLVEIQVDPGGSYESNMTFKLDARRFRPYVPQNVYHVQAIPREDGQQNVEVSHGRKRLFRLVHSEILDRLFMVQHSIDLNDEFRKMIGEVVAGETLPMRLSVKRFQVRQAFDHLVDNTSLAREFEKLQMPDPDRKRVIEHLKGRVVLCLITGQSGLVGGNHRIRNVGSILHSFDGLADLEKRYPELVQSVRKRSARSQIGDYYLLSEFSSSTDPALGDGLLRPVPVTQSR